MSGGTEKAAKKNNHGKPTQYVKNPSAKTEDLLNSMHRTGQTPRTQRNQLQLACRGRRIHGNLGDMMILGLNKTTKTQQWSQWWCLQNPMQRLTWNQRGLILLGIKTQLGTTHGPTRLG
jgi:hypothetical protein